MSVSLDACPTPDTITDLLTRCRALNASLANFAAYQASQRPRPVDAPVVELRALQRLVTAELKTLERIGTQQRPGSTDLEPALSEDEDEDDTKQSAAGPTPPQHVQQRDTRSRPVATPATAHVLRSTNLRYLEAVWRAAVQSRGLVAFHKRFNCEEALDAVPGGPGKSSPRTALVDAVVDNGRMWLKLSTVTEKRLLFERARSGWDSESEESISSNDDDEDDQEARSDDSSRKSPGLKDGTKISALADGAKVSALADGASSLAHEDPSFTAASPARNDEQESRSLARIAQQLKHASQRVWVGYRHPHVRFILPNLPPEASAGAATVAALRAVRAQGAEVVCGGDSSNDNSSSDPVMAPQTNLDHLLPALHPELTVDLNLDCTILLALVSDVSHLTIAADAALHPAINRQIAREQLQPLLPTLLYPALAGRTLHCSVEAAARMRDIVATIGTPAEVRRTALLLGTDDAAVTQPAAERAQQWAAESTHMAPTTLRLPVLVDALAERDQAALPAHASAVAEACRLSAINRSVWMLGWARRWVTVTSNRVVARQVEGCVEVQLAAAERAAAKLAGAELVAETDKRPGAEEVGRNADFDRGPRVWVVGTARSLIKKESGRRP